MWFEDDKNNPITDADWAEEMSDVKPIKGQERVRRTHLDAYQVESLELDEELEEWPEKHQAYNPNYSWNERNKYERVAAVDIPETQEFFVDIMEETDCFAARRPSIKTDIFNTLKKGQVAFQRRIDLHGMLEDEAWGALCDFLNQAYSANVRAVLVIHGKGKGYGDKKDMGIIKANISAWLRSSPVVLAYHTAQPRHGGSGAVCVMIRRNKNVTNKKREDEE